MLESSTCEDPLSAPDIVQQNAARESDNDLLRGARAVHGWYTHTPICQHLRASKPCPRIVFWGGLMHVVGCCATRETTTSFGSFTDLA